MRRVNVNVLGAPDTASANGVQIDANQLVSASFQAHFGDATATGTLKVQMSNDPCAFGSQAADFTVVNWTDVPSATAAVASGASVVITLPQISYRWLRVVYTRASGGSTVINVSMFALSV